MWHGGIERPAPGTGIKITFRDSSGKDIKTVEANEGDDILSIAHEYDIDLEGACEGSIACSTCHVILDEDVYYSLEEPGDDENDMLDLAFGLTDTYVRTFALWQVLTGTARAWAARCTSPRSTTAWSSACPPPRATCMWTARAAATEVRPLSLGVANWDSRSAAALPNVDSHYRTARICA